MGSKDKPKRPEDPDHGNKDRSDGGRDKSTGSAVNDAYCPKCDVWYNSSRDAAVAAHSGH